VKIVPIAVFRRDTIDRSAIKAASIDVPIHCRHIDVFTVGIEHMVVVEFGEALEVDTGQAPLPRTDIETPETTVPVDEQKGAVERPVRCLDEHRVGFK